MGSQEIILAFDPSKHDPTHGPRRDSRWAREEDGFDGPPSPEDFTPAPPKPPSPLSRLPSREGARVALVCFAFFASTSVIYWNDPAIGAHLPVSGERVFGHGEYYRLVTALFTHSGIAHLLANTPLFLIFGWFLRSFFGLIVFPVAAFAIGILSNLATIALYDPQMKLVGASGMLYGMIALWLVLYVYFETTHSVAHRLMRAIAFSLVVMFPTTFRPQTSYLAHGIGFVFGLAAGLGLAPFLKVVGLEAEQDRTDSRRARDLNGGESFPWEN